jgi:hypothetical protein
MHDSASGFPGFIYRKKERIWDAGTKGKLIVHESVTERKLNRQNSPDPAYDPWVLKQDHEIEQWDRDFNEKG